MRERRIRRAAAIAAMLGSIIAASAVPASASASAMVDHGLGQDDRPGPCALVRGQDEGIRAFSTRIITCAAERWPVPGGADRAVCIADRESGLIPTAQSPTGMYLGLFQHSAEAWGDRYLEWTRPVWQLKPNALNGRTNAVVTMRMANAFGWGPWAGVGC
jgi:hypothetical protein